MLTMEAMIGMLRQPGDNVLDNETLYRLLQIDGAYASAVQRQQALEPYLRSTQSLIKLLRTYNPSHPMGAGMAAQFTQLMQELENHGRG